MRVGEDVAWVRVREVGNGYGQGCGRGCGRWYGPGEWRRCGCDAGTGMGMGEDGDDDVDTSLGGVAGVDARTRVPSLQ
jgi:hypothetical protein